MLLKATSIRTGVSILGKAVFRKSISSLRTCYLWLLCGCSCERGSRSSVSIVGAGRQRYICSSNLNDLFMYKSYCLFQDCSCHLPQVETVYNGHLDGVGHLCASEHISFDLYNPRHCCFVLFLSSSVSTLV